jgi:serpin B
MTKHRGQFSLGLMVSLLGVGALTGCSGNGSSDNGGDKPGGVISELRSSQPRVTADVAEAAPAAKGEQDFAFAFLHALDKSSNVAFSPHSLSTAFAMLTDAADGQTLQEVEQVMHFPQTDEAFHRSQDALQLGLAARNHAALQTEQQTVDAQILTESNDVWIRDDVPPQPSYLDTLARFYGVGVHHADFPLHPEESRVAINAKVSDDTHALIPELIPQGAIDPDTVSVLTNAIYFKAPWENHFAAPVAGDFHQLDGSVTSAQLMHGGGRLAYYGGDGFVSVAVPYYGGELELMLVVPDAGAYETVRTSLSSDALTQIVGARQMEQVELTLPKFDVKSTVPATEILKALGMKTPFDQDAAQFPKFASEKYNNVFVSQVLHQATVAIDEKGTEASAATAIILAGTTSAIIEPPTPKVVTVDRPFLFVIRDNPTGAVLFVGQVVAP